MAPVLLALAAQTITLPFMRDVLPTDSGAILMMPPIHIAGPTVGHPIWSADGKRLLVAGIEGMPEKLQALSKAVSPSTVEAFLVVWDADTRKSREVFRGKQMPRDYQWMGSTILIQTFEDIPSGPARPEPGVRTKVQSWTSANGLQTVLTLDDDVDSQLIASPKLPYAIVASVGDSRGRVGWLLTPNRPSRRIDLPRGWFMADEEGYINATERYEEAGKTRNRWYRVEMDGTIRQLPQSPTLPKRLLDEPRAPSDLVATMSTASASYGQLAKVSLVDGWLTGFKDNKTTAALVAADADQLELSPDKRFVLYRSQESLFARPLRALSKAEFEEMLDAAEKMELMSRAKQLGTAMMIYGSDNGDKFPPKNGFMETLMPYTKNAAFFQGFVYEMDGQDMTKIEDPAKTAVGYIQGRKGRAVVYADSHVKWIPDP